MNSRFFTASAIALCLALGGTALAFAQDQAPMPPAATTPDAATPPATDPNATPSAETPPAPEVPQTPAEMFRLRCHTCHVEDNSGNGPTLKGVLNRKIASVKDFTKYSPALKAQAGKWDEASLDAYITRPAAFVPGTKMFNSMANPDIRAALIGYLKTYK